LDLTGQDVDTHTSVMVVSLIVTCQYECNLIFYRTTNLHSLGIARISLWLH